jgi:hypothetical protein
MKTFFKLLASKIFEPGQKYSEKILLSLFKNKFILKLFLVKDCSFLEFASEKLKDDKQLVLTIVKKNGFVLAYSSERLKDDKEVVMAAVQTDGWSLQYASDRLKDDYDVVMASVGNKEFSLSSPLCKTPSFRWGINTS